MFEGDQPILQVGADGDLQYRLREPMGGGVPLGGLQSLDDLRTSARDFDPERLVTT